MAQQLKQDLMRGGRLDESVEPSLQDDLIWGIEAIGGAINRSPRATYHLLENGRLPAKKVGNRWCSSKSALRRFFAAQFRGVA